MRIGSPLAALAVLICGLTAPLTSTAQILQNQYVLANFDASQVGVLNTSDRNAPGIRFLPTGVGNFGDIANELLTFPFTPNAADNYFLNYTVHAPTGAIPVTVVNGSPSEGVFSTNPPFFSNGNQNLNFVVNLATAAGLPPYLSITTVAQLLNAAGPLGQRLCFTVTLDNLGTAPLTDFTYLRTVNPFESESQLAFNAGAGGLLPAKNLDYNNLLAGGLAINTRTDIPLTNSNERQFAVGSTQVGAQLNSIGDAFTNDINDPALLAQYAQLLSGSFSVVGSPIIPSAPAVNVFFQNIPDLSPGSSYTIGPYYYIFGGPVSGTAVPEPENWLFSVAALVVVVPLVRRSRRRTVA